MSSPVILPADPAPVLAWLRSIPGARKIAQARTRSACLLAAYLHAQGAEWVSVGPDYYTVRIGGVTWFALRLPEWAQQLVRLVDTLCGYRQVLRADEGWDLLRRCC